MRIITGALKGHSIHDSHGHRTHPMSEKVRGALFNALGDIEGLTFLDAYGGSGALALEAVSRGAKSAVAVEIDKNAFGAITQNIQDMKVNSRVKAVRANISGWSIHNMEKSFDVILLDPPYDQIRPDILQKLMNRHIKKAGLAVLSYLGKEKAPEFEGMTIIANKKYGDAQLVFYRKNK